MSENFFDLTGKVAIVTGTSRGLAQVYHQNINKAPDISEPPRFLHIVWALRILR